MADAEDACVTGERRCITWESPTVPRVAPEDEHEERETRQVADHTVRTRRADRLSVSRWHSRPVRKAMLTQDAIAERSGERRERHDAEHPLAGRVMVASPSALGGAAWNPGGSPGMGFAVQPDRERSPTQMGHVGVVDCFEEIEVQFTAPSAEFQREGVFLDAKL